MTAEAAGPAAPTDLPGTVFADSAPPARDADRAPPARDADRALPSVPARWWWGTLVGGLAATACFAYVLAIGQADLTRAPTGDFYDLQVRAWFDGRWDVAPFTTPDGDPLVDGLGNPVTPLSIEAIVVDGRAYLYYGPVPSLLRVPFLAVTDGLDGRTTQPAMLAAYVLLLGAATVLHWRIRVLVRGRWPGVGTGGAVLSGLVTFGVGAGSVVLFLASQPTVYHEANLWGLAFSVAAYAALLRLQVQPSVAAVAWAGTWTAAALLSRASVGAGPLVALVLVGLLLARQGWRDRSGRPVGRGVAVALAVALAVPVVGYVGVNLARFGEPVRLPLEKQVFSQVDEQRQAALAANGGSLFSLSYLPSTTWQYLRPDALRVDAWAPWLTFPQRQATVIGGAVFDTRDEASSVPATMPAWTVLAAVGAVAVVRRVIRRSGRDQVGHLVVPVVGALVGSAGVLVIGFIAHRYVGDLFPPVLVLGLCGVQVVAGWVRRQQPAIQVMVAADLALLGAVGVAVNGALALEYQRLIAPVDPATRTAFVLAQDRWSPDEVAALRAGAVRDEAEVVGSPGERGDLRVVEDEGRGCVAVWWSDGFGWHPLTDPDRVCARIERPGPAGDGATPPDP